MKRMATSLARWLSLQLVQMQSHLLGLCYLRKSQRRALFSIVTTIVKKAVKLFDYVHSLDSERLALKISQYQKELNKEIKLFIQVNLGGEKQKSGLTLNNLHTFYNYCVNELSLNIIGLMCLPPIDSDSVKYFKLLKKTSENFNLKELSMGMSSDFEEAVINGSTFLRLGTLILGKRNII